MVAVIKPWTMDVALNRKRSASTPPPDEDGAAIFAVSTSEPPKRTKTGSELDEICITPPNEAWPIDLSSILSSPTVPAPDGSNLKHVNNLANFVPGQSITVVCVQGHYHLHYDLLW